MLQALLHQFHVCADTGHVIIKACQLLLQCLLLDSYNLRRLVQGVYSPEAEPHTDGYVRGVLDTGLHLHSMAQVYQTF